MAFFFNISELAIYLSLERLLSKIKVTNTVMAKVGLVTKSAMLWLQRENSVDTLGQETFPLGGMEREGRGTRRARQNGEQLKT